MRDLATKIVYSNLEETRSVYLSHIFVFSEAVEFCETKYGIIIMKL